MGGYERLQEGQCCFPGPGPESPPEWLCTFKPYMVSLGWFGSLFHGLLLVMQEEFPLQPWGPHEDALLGLL